MSERALYRDLPSVALNIHYLRPVIVSSLKVHAGFHQKALSTSLVLNNQLKN